MTLLVGTAQASYYEQAAAANLKVPMGIVGQCRPGLRAQALHAAEPRQHVRRPPTTSRRSTRPRARPSSRSGSAKFPNEPYINQEAENSYIAIYLYKQMVERAEVDRPRRDPQA